MNRIKHVSKLPWLAALLAAAIGLSARGNAQVGKTPDVPGNLKPPAGEKLIWWAHASGVQIYSCQSATGGNPQWTLKAPQAELRDDKGVIVGHHYAGPTWEHQDGSHVTGKPAARADSPDAGAIPWLLITAVAHSERGVLSHVTSIQRIHTKNGQPPTAACDASKLGSEAESPYTADYYFYAP